MDANADDAVDPGRPREGVRFEYDPGVVGFGAGCVDDLERELERQGIDRALVVCGSTVGATPPVIDPVKAGLGDRLAGVFAETSVEKRLETGAEGAAAMAEADADGLVSLGGGSSLDVAKAVSVLAARDGSLAAAAAEFADRGTLSIPDGVLPPIVAVPTTLAGADLSQVAGLNAYPDGALGAAADEAGDAAGGGTLPDGPVGGGLADRRLLPAAVFYDPELFATTPYEVLAGSAMNGFDKGLETLYARNATPITDATAARGLGLLREALPALGAGDGSYDVAALERAVEGVLLVQYGISRPDGTTLSLVHAFGHGLRDRGDVQQGIAHAVVAPHALRYLFDRVGGRRGLLADALGVPRENRSDDEIAAGVVDAVAEVRDALDLPSRLRAVDGLERDDLPAVAAATLEDSFVGNGPPGLEPTAEDLLGVLEAAW